MTRQLLTHLVTFSGDKHQQPGPAGAGTGGLTWVGRVLQLGVSVTTRGGQGLTVLQSIRRGAGVTGKDNIYSRESSASASIGPDLMV